MKTTTEPKKELLLGVGLNVLHQESREWLATIAFWKDETKFFADLLNRKEDLESGYGEILSYLEKIHKNLFDYLADDIKEHERLLSRLEKAEKGLSDGDYREKHRSLATRMNLFTNEFREFKKMVFGYAKKL